MKVINNFENVQATTGEFPRPQPNGYICKIINVEDVPLDISNGKGDYLRIEYDIEEGEFEGYYKDQFTKWGGNWNASFIRSYKEKALGMFKHFTNCIEKSNNNYDWDWNEKGLIGKVVGLVLGEEEYENSMGEIKTKLSVKDIKTVEDIKNGNFKIPTTKKIERANNINTIAPNFEVLSADEELPF